MPDQVEHGCTLFMRLSAQTLTSSIVLRHHKDTVFRIIRHILLRLTRNEGVLVGNVPISGGVDILGDEILVID